MEPSLNCPPDFNIETVENDPDYIEQQKIVVKYAQVFQMKLKNKEGIDTYDSGLTLNPFFKRS